ncbi:hypothetical protein LOTGIDRAFT_175510 [Lottia gigantea]|uniref:2-oxoisovalerate dehydrogenase subunit alpha n=1 Tax=Lottia gigantea TaxID=225164 RepID=V4BY99_LOTGI|nr:hypothetical protein LOTGIDRAFT_175510 [Lottia gigantea]ESO94099.1 hypothetical protein LOTGIDRAFT_175510 [Lottia gigantea]
MRDLSSLEGGGKLPKTTELKFLNPDENPRIPVYRVLARNGHLLQGASPPSLDKTELLEMYHQMVTLNIMDTALNVAERQGLIPFYLTNFGEEATQIGSASAVKFEDFVFGQYRETGVLLWRGFRLEDFANQCFNNDLDGTKGRQMPVHYGSKEHNFMTISSTLATQMPQAAGAAYAMKMSKSENCVVCYFGEGTTSEGDAHAAFNFAAVLKCPVIFFCRNNGFAISTPASEQYSGDGVASRGAGYGIPSIRVDGNDVLAVYNVTKVAREICVSESRPVLIEAMTYRVGDHSTLVDSSGYRHADDVSTWDTRFNPITRFKKYLLDNDIWDEEREETFKQSVIRDVEDALRGAQERKYCNPTEMFTDVYNVMPKNLEKQHKEFKEHLQKYQHEYDLEKFHPDI